MHTRFRYNISIWFKSGGTISAVAAVVLLNFFPDARLVGILLVLVTGVLFWTGQPVTSVLGRRMRRICTPLDGPVLLLLSQIGVAYWASALPDRSWVSACQLVAGVVAYYTIINWSQDRIRLWSVVAVLVLLGFGLALVAPFVVDWFRDRKTFLPAALYSFFPLLLSDPVHPNVMAGSLATLLPLPLALFLALTSVPERRFWLRGVLLAICLLQFLVLALTKSRGGYLALGAGLWLTLWLSGRRRWAIGLMLMMALLVAWLVTRSPGETSGPPHLTQVALDTSTWAFRQRVWNTAIKIINDFPFTGAGLGTFNDVAALLYGFYSPKNPQAHNLFLQVAVDLGLPGLVYFIAILLLVLGSAFRAYDLFDAQREKTLRAVTVGGLAGMVATIVHGLVDSHTWGSKGAFIPWAMMGLIVALHTQALSLSSVQTDDQEPINR